MRSVPDRIDPNTSKQQEVRSRFRVAVRFYQKIKETPLKGILELSADKICSSGYALFMKKNLKAFRANGKIGDFSQLHFSAGKRQQAYYLQGRMDERGTVTLDWENDEANPKEGSGDYKNRHGALCRLAEIYLSYAEALNEYSIEKGTYTANQKEILKYVNLIRERAGIPEYSVSAEEGKITAPSDPVEMRELIRQERRVELNCESGLRFNDLRRWKLAEKVLDGDFYGMNAYIKVSDADYRNKYYTRTVYQTRKFISYWWPIPQDDIDKNWNLVQTPDWTVGNQ